MNPGRRRAAVSVVAGAAVALLLVTGLAVPGWALPRTEGCQLGTAVGAYAIWTPLSLVNSPEGGNVNAFADSWHYTFASGGLTITSPPWDYPGGSGQTNASPGIFSSYGEFNWTFYRTQNVSGVGTGGSPCTQPYVAQFTQGASSGGLCVIPIPNGSSDMVEPHSFNGTGTDACPVTQTGPYVSFYTAFPAGDRLPGSVTRLDLCNLTGTYPLQVLGPAYVPVAVTVPYEGRNISATGQLSWFGDSSASLPFDHFTASYDVPAGWNWALSTFPPTTAGINLNLPLPGLVAFVRSAC